MQKLLESARVKLVHFSRKCILSKLTLTESAAEPRGDPVVRSLGAVTSSLSPSVAPSSDNGAALMAGTGVGFTMVIVFGFSFSFAFGSATDCCGTRDMSTAKVVKMLFRK